MDSNYILPDPLLDYTINDFLKYVKENEGVSIQRVNLNFSLLHRECFEINKEVHNFIIKNPNDLICVFTNDKIATIIITTKNKNQIIELLKIAKYEYLEDDDTISFFIIK